MQKCIYCIFLIFCYNQAMNKKESISLQVEEDLKEAIANFSAKLKELRQSKDLSMSDLYKLSGVSSSTINDLEKAKYAPNLDVFLKLGYALDLSKKAVLNILLKEDKDKQSKDLTENSLDLIKATLQCLDLSVGDIEEILEYIRFKNRKNCNFYK